MVLWLVPLSEGSDGDGIQITVTPTYTHPPDIHEVNTTKTGEGHEQETQEEIDLLILLAEIVLMTDILFTFLFFLLLRNVNGEEEAKRIKFISYDIINRGQINR